MTKISIKLYGYIYMKILDLSYKSDVLAGSLHA
jgi:hypothetical protein